MDQEFYNRNSDISMTCGAVSVSCFIIGNMLYCINVGDARAVICRNGKAVNLSFDHKATCKKEQKLVKKRGGYMLAGRVLGKLAITRSFGDFEMKVQKDEKGKI